MLRIFAIVLILNVGCTTPSMAFGRRASPDLTELCVLNGDGTAECDADEGEYTLQPGQLETYITMSPDNYARILKWGRRRGR